MQSMTHLALAGGTEYWIVGGLIVLLFGSRKLPELARSMGTSITQFKKGLKEGDSEPAQLEESKAEKPAGEAS